ncbi:PREDICTED: serine/threonine-protein kinase ATM-like, partial [Camelina sativa]|uniref:Serine/threonine-protein kinase ATM-like n=1 Tax=Camelina sativa TaxID=90675 RepID=A0ABM1RS41_CAMSA
SSGSIGNMLTAGSRVSENRERGGDSDKQLKEEDDVKMEDVNDDDSERIEDYVMSEVSSLRDNFEEIENGFHVGDFVWGEGVNGQRWWPGQIYDSSHASDLALKTMQKGKLLVAYFGDGSFSWCNPLELKPFLENFNEFSKMSGSRGFLSAVEEAVREIGEHVEQFLVCDEAAALVSSVAVNPGVKDGVVVPDVRREIVSSLILEKPGVVLDDVKGLAKTVSYSDLLEFEVLKRKISAYYRCKGRFDLAKYVEHQYIIGLEDKEEDESFQLRSSRKCSGFVKKNRKCGDVATTGSTTRRWRRLSEVSKVENAEEELSNRKSLSSRKRKSKKSVVDSNDDEEIEKRVESNDSNHLEESEKKDDGSGIETDVNLATPLASLSKRLRIDVSSSVERNNDNGETLVQTGKRERKKRKYLSPEYMTDFSCRARKSKLESADRVTPEKAVDIVKLGATAEEMLDLIRRVALSTKYPEDYNSSCDMVREFVSIYRSFTHKRNLSDGEDHPEVMDEKEQTRDEPNEKQFSGVELFIKTDLGSTLPSKDYLIKTYKTFGALDMGRSYTFDNNSSAVIAFSNVSDGEAAYYKTLEKCPFAATSTVTFKLKYPSSASSSPESTNEKTETETRKGVMEIECLKEKLEEIRSLLDQSEGMITEEVKMKLEDESRNLLGKVTKLIIVRPS